jgi:CheY-like chemotaxis protein
VEKLNILLVEDDPVSMRRLSSDVKRLGHIPHEADDATEALEIYTKDFAMDMVITDLQLPNSNGADLIRSIRKMSLDIPIIVVSGTIDGKVLKLIKKLNCADILVKPYDKNRLKDLIESEC